MRPSLVGIILGDGNLYKRRGNFELRVTLNKKELRYSEIVSGLMKEALFEEPKLRFKKKEKSIDLRIQKRGVVEGVAALGLDYGNRVKKNTGIPRWIFSNEDFLKFCLRGLIDTDGSVYRLTPHWPNLWQLSFKSNNRRLLRDARRAFVVLGFRPSRIFGNRIVLTRQGEIARYFKDVGTNNDKYSPVV